MGKAASGSTQRGQLFGFLLWSALIIFPCCQYILRSAPSVMLPDLTAYFSLSNAGLSALIGSYFLGYALGQVAAGIMLEIYGGRKVIPFAILICAVSSWLFLSHSLLLAYVARISLGFGSGFAIVSTIYVASNWLPARYMAFITGSTTALGYLGGIIGQIGLARLVMDGHWQWVWNVGLVMGVCLVVVYAVLIPNRPKQFEMKGQDHMLLHSLGEIKTILSKKTLWMIGVSTALMYIVVPAFILLWGIPFLSDKFHLDAHGVSYLMLFAFVGLIVGGIVNAIIAEFYLRRKIHILVGALLLLISFVMLVYVHVDVIQAKLLLFMIGASSSVTNIPMLLAEESFPIKFKSLSLSMFMCITFIFIFVLTPLLGYILDYISAYLSTPVSLPVFEKALWFFPAAILLSLVGFIFVKETGGQQVQG